MRSTPLFVETDSFESSDFHTDGELRQFTDVTLSRILIVGESKTLEQLNAGLETSADVASHDVSAPLCEIHPVTAMIDADLNSLLTGAAREHMTSLNSRVARVDALLDEIRDDSRTGRADEPGERTNIDQIAVETAQMLTLSRAFFGTR